MKFKDRVNLEYKVLCDKFDKRDEFYTLLQIAFDKYGSIPPKYLADWNAYQRDKRKWRDIPVMVKTLKRIARKNARNQLRTSGKKAEMARGYLDKQLKKMGKVSRLK